MIKTNAIYFISFLICFISTLPKQLTLTKLESIKHSKKQFSEYKKIFWWQIFPTTGLRLEEPFWPLTYPFLPHAFSLWELAPSLGNNITVALIDTGVSAFTFTHKCHTYTKHPDLFIEGNFSKTSYNMLPFQNRSINAYKNLVQLIHYYSTEPTTKQIVTTLPTWLHQYAISKKTTGLDAYLHTYGKSYLLQKNKPLFSEEGLRAHRKIVYGDCGFEQFPTTHLQTPYNQTHAIIPFIPVPDLLPSNPLTLQLHNNDHGTHVASIIGGRLHPNINAYIPFTTSSCAQLLLDDTGLCGLAPRCSLFMIKALHAGTTSTNPAYILDALYAARSLSPDILNLSCKCSHPNRLPKKIGDELEKEIKKFPYLCASGGNDALEKELSYPARYDSILFSVGAFECHYNATTKKFECPLCPFTQYEKDKGPFYVAPGKDILGCSFIPNSHETFYALHTGTSYATPIMTGFLTLMLGEFKDDFTHKQLLFICQNACFRLHATPAWKTKVIYGVIDMRTALFTLHVAKKLFAEKPSLKKEWEKVFSTIFAFLYNMANTWGRQIGAPCNFKEGFIDYFNRAHTKTPPYILKTDPFTSVEKASAFTCAAVLEELAR